MDDLIRVPFTEIRHNKISEPCSDTGKWLLGLEVFTSWRDGPQNSLLWVKGSPGQGKSVLAKLVTKHLEDKASKEKCAVIYFFCYAQEESFSRASDILRALIIQLVDCQEQFKHLPTEFTKDSKSFFTAPLAQLWELFQKLVMQKLQLTNKCQRIYCVIDALDECSQDNDQRSDLLRYFVGLLSKEQMHVKILITSRPGEKDIEEQLEGMPSWSLQADPEDLKKLIDSKIERLPVCIYNDQLKTKVLDLLHRQAGRTFLWVSIVVKEIEDLEAPSLHEIESVFEENPKPLNQLYGRQLSRIAASDTATKTFSKLLIWVAYSRRPLTVGELEDAITYDPSTRRYKSLSEMERHRRPWQLICNKLRTLLEVEKKFDRIRLSYHDCVYFNHQSVRDYFHNNRDEALKDLKFVDSGGPDLYLARTCIWYLNAKEFQERFLESDFQPTIRQWILSGRKDFPEYHSALDRYPFFGYTSSQWYKHVTTIEVAKSEWNQVQNLLDHRKSLLEVWSGTHVARIRHRSWRAVMKLPDATKFTRLVVHFDISWLAELIVTGQIEAEHFEESDIIDMAQYAPKSFQCLLRLDIKGILITKEIIERAVRSREAIASMQLLLDHWGQEIEITEDLVMVAASNYWHGPGEGVVQLLLKQEAAAGIRITEAILESAAKNRNDKVMRLLLTDRGKEIKITEAVLEAAVSNRSSERKEEILQLLLDHESAAGIRITEGMLKSAASNERVMRAILTRRGKEIKITEAVLEAVAKSWVGCAMMRLLLEQQGEEIRITENVVIAAASNPVDPDVFKLLLEKRGSDVRITQNVLLAAAVSELSTLRLLLERRGSEAVITEQFVEAAAKPYEGLENLELLREMRGASLNFGDELAAEIERQILKLSRERERREKRVRERREKQERFL